MTFAILGIIGIAWGVIWYFWFRDSPSEHPGISEKELRYIEENVQQPTAAGESEKISFGKMFKSKTMWLIMGQYFSSNFTFFFCLTWLFPHLKATYNLESVEAGFYASAPLIFGAIGNWVSGWMVDFIYRKKRWELSRKLPAIIGFSLATIGILASIYMEEVTGAVVFISLAVFGADMTLSPSWSACVDIGKEHSGTVSGTMNMAGNLGSFFTALAFPYLLSMTGSGTPFFFVAATLNLLAILMWLAIKPQKALKLT
jgi:ACS family glucarate transporter-like MFS transporter